MISARQHGGDQETGLADNGVFHKISGGLIYRPWPSLALKGGFSVYVQDINDKQEVYTKLGLQLAYLWS